MKPQQDKMGLISARLKKTKLEDGKMLHRQIKTPGTVSREINVSQVDSDVRNSSGTLTSKTSSSS